MKRQELVDRVAAGTGDSKTATSEVNALFKVSTHAVAGDDPIRLAGFDTISVGRRPARTGRALSTGAEIHICEAKTDKLTAGKSINEAVNAS
ncbi:DNA-binding protein [Paraburkholderia sp. UYCP14C]|uniref:HU family DNA-binding protein n=1 Tax=Paraburkholderia sp. UYCP14C TaxID=2511130 RepID=UPI001020FAE8|nr:HU family DNA-binding protein [Paraburkholderia sp. UYCP14C]RZF26681.1 DNA-binding protein [Paraburkholderia sp. UYCP14C]